MNSVPLDFGSRRCTLAACNLNQWALDFDGNLERTIESIKQSKLAGARYRLGPELEISGYGCEDHFLEPDTFTHCEQSLAAILQSGVTNDILCDIGCPMMHRNVRYNCRVYCLNGKIVFIRPKMFLADDGNYREERYFVSWKHPRTVQDHTLSPLLTAAVRGSNGSTEPSKSDDLVARVPFGDAIICLSDTMMGPEMCEELWAPYSPHTAYALAGVEIFTNGSGSHHNLRKLNTRWDLMRSSMKKCGGVYLYANQRGCDGGRLYYDGSSLVCCNDSLLAQATQFSLRDVEVVAACVDLDDVVRARQCNASYQEQGSTSAVSQSGHSFDSSMQSGSVSFPEINLRYFALCTDSDAPLTTAKEFRIRLPEEECLLGPACWLWDYLRRSGAKGVLLPLSGGADSASVATIVYTMCVIAEQECAGSFPGCLVDTGGASNGEHNGSGVNTQVLKDMNRLLGRSVDSNIGSATTLASPVSAKELCSHILHTIYIGTSNSSKLTQSRAERLAGSVSAYHHSFNVDLIVQAFLTVFGTLFPKHKPAYSCHGGSQTQDLALQNIQARVRMVIAYLFAQLLPWVRSSEDGGGASGGGFLLVLGSSNVDECLRGYMTKYDCSSADINPIGGISKVDLKKMLLFASKTYQLPVLHEIATAPPSAELRPIETAASADGESTLERDGYSQTDEEDMGMTYDELCVYGSLRKLNLCGPVSMFVKLLGKWTHLTASVIAAKVKSFFFYYGINRHKMTTLTPAYHAEGYSPDDNRFDLRPFLYNSKWTRQFRTIDHLVQQRAGGGAALPSDGNK